MLEQVSLEQDSSLQKKPYMSVNGFDKLPTSYSLKL